jgi:para-aminobenzoate synthetase component I
MTERELAIRQMNQWGGERRPFFFLIDFEMLHPVVLPMDKVSGEGIRFQMPVGPISEGFIGRCKESTSPSNKTDIRMIRLSHVGYSCSRYEDQFQQVIRHIRAGDSFLVNLTCQTSVRLDIPLTELYDGVRAKYKLLYKDRFLVFSPETFVQIRNGIISSCPMKGTLDASLPNACERLLGNPKEKAEHSTIVDLIRNDLSIVATKVKVQRFRYIEEIAAGSGRLLQVSSEITGQLAADYPERIGDILFALLPAGSVTGAPKKRTVEIIRETEDYERGYYTGIFGIFDGKNLDSAVLIRFLENTPSGMVYKSGGGVTAQSNMNDEYEEMLQKIYVPLY